MNVFWAIVGSPTFIIAVVAGFLWLKSKGYFQFRAKKKFELETKEVP